MHGATFTRAFGKLKTSRKKRIRLILLLSGFECFRDAEIRAYHGIKVTTLTRVYERFYGNTLLDISVIFFPSELCSLRNRKQFPLRALLDSVTSPQSMSHFTVSQVDNLNTPKTKRSTFKS